MANWLDKIEEGGDTPVNYNSIPSTGLKYPKIFRTDGNSYYVPVEETIYLNPDQYYGDPSVLQHEMFHHWQNLNDKLRVPDEYQGPLAKPSIVAKDKSDYYNRREVETNKEFDNFYNTNPMFKLVNPNLIYDKQVNPSLYSNPEYGEGEAQAYQEYIRGGGRPVFPTYAQGGLIKRADGSYSRRGLWDNIRANKGSGRKPTAEMLRQERKIKKHGDGSIVEGEEPKSNNSKNNNLLNKDYNPLMNLSEAQRFPAPVQTTVTYPEGYVNQMFDLKKPVLNTMGKPYATGAVEQSAISPLDLIGFVKGGIGLTKGVINYSKAMKPNYVQIGDDLFNLGPHPKTVNRAINKMHKGAQEITLPSPFADGSWVTNSSIPTPTTPSFYDAGADRTLTNYQMGTPKAHMYGGGGGVNPIYVTNPNDPRLKAYNDSLSLYNAGLQSFIDYGKINNIPQFTKGNYTSDKTIYPALNNTAGAWKGTQTLWNVRPQDNRWEIEVAIDDINNDLSQRVLSKEHKKNLETRLNILKQSLNTGIYPVDMVYPTSTPTQTQFSGALVYEKPKQKVILEELKPIKAKTAVLLPEVNFDEELKPMAPMPTSLYRKEINPEWDGEGFFNFYPKYKYWGPDDKGEQHVIGEREYNRNTKKADGGPVMYNAGSTVFTKQNSALWVNGGKEIGTQDKRYPSRNTGSLDPDYYTIGDNTLLPKSLHAFDPSAGTHDYNQDVQPYYAMRLHAPDTTMMGDGGPTPSYAPYRAPSVIGVPQITQLTPSQEIAYQRYKQSLGDVGGDEDYDLRGFWKEEGVKGLTDSGKNGVHFTDKYKILNLNSPYREYDALSDESKYASEFDRRGQGYWNNNDEFVSYKHGGQIKKHINSPRVYGSPVNPSGMSEGPTTQRGITFGKGGLISMYADAGIVADCPEGSIKDASGNCIPVTGMALATANLRQSFLNSQQQAANTQAQVQNDLQAAKRGIVTQPASTTYVAPKNLIAKQFSQDLGAAGGNMDRMNLMNGLKEAKRQEQPNTIKAISDNPNEDPFVLAQDREDWKEVAKGAIKLTALAGGLEGAYAIPYAAPILDAAFITHGISQVPETVEAWQDPNVSVWDATKQTTGNALDFFPAFTIGKHSMNALKELEYNNPKVFNTLNDIGKGFKEVGQGVWGIAKEHGRGMYDAVTTGPRQIINDLYRRGFRNNVTFAQGPSTITPNPLNLDQQRLVNLRDHLYSGGVLTPEDINFMSSHPEAQFATTGFSNSTLPRFEFEANLNINNWNHSGSYNPNGFSLNRSGLTKDEAIQQLGSNYQSTIDNMTEKEFKESVITPTGELKPYTPTLSLNNVKYNMGQGYTLSDVKQVPVKDYVQKFNSNIDRLNEIINSNNKTGVPVKVKELTESGMLYFEMPDGSTKTWGVGINPGEWKGVVEDINNTEYYKAIPGLNMNNTINPVFLDANPRRGSGVYQSLNEFLKELEMGRVKSGFGYQTNYSGGLWKNAVTKGKAHGFYGSKNAIYGAMKKSGGYVDRYDDGSIVGEDPAYEAAKQAYTKASSMGIMGEKQMQDLVRQYPQLANDASLAGTRSVGNAALYKANEEHNRIETNTLGQVLSTPESRQKAYRQEVVTRRPEVYNVEDYKMGIQEPGAPNDITNDPLAMAVMGTAIGTVGLGTRGIGALTTDFAGNLISETTGGLSDIGNWGFRKASNYMPSKAQIKEGIKMFAESPHTAISKAIYPKGTIKGDYIRAFNTPIIPSNINDFPSVVYNNKKPLTDVILDVANDARVGAVNLDSRVQKKLADLSTKEGFERLYNLEYEKLVAQGITDATTLATNASVNANRTINALKNYENVNRNFSGFLYNNLHNIQDLNDLQHYANYYDYPVFNAHAKMYPNNAHGGILTMGYGYSKNSPTFFHEINHILQGGVQSQIDQDLIKNLKPKKFNSIFSNPKAKEDYNYFSLGPKNSTTPSVEPSSFLADLREAMIERGFMKDTYDEVTPELMEKAYNHFKKNPSMVYQVGSKGGKFQNNTRIFGFAKPTKSNFKLLSDNMNKLPMFGGVGIVGAGLMNQASDEDNIQKQANGGYVKNSLSNNWLNTYN